MRKTVCMPSMMVLLWITAGAAGQQTWWQRPAGEPGSWFEAANWTSGVPTSGVDAMVDNGGTALVGGAAAVHVLYVGYDGSGTVLHTDGTLTSSSKYGGINLGYSSGTSGAYELSGHGVVNAREWILIGERGSGVFRQSGGEAHGKIIEVGGDPTGVGDYILSGGLANADFLILGHQGQGTFCQTGGVCQVRTMHIGYSFGHGDFTLSDGSFICASFSIGTGYTWGASRPPACGTALLTGAGELSGVHMFVGGYGSGALTQTGGTVALKGNLYVGYKIEKLGTGPGEYRIQAGRADAENVYVGHGGNGTFAVQGAGAQITFTTYTQTERGQLITEVTAGGVSPIVVTGEANLSRTWVVGDAGAPLGRFDVLTAAAGISGPFDVVTLPGPDWLHGISGGDTLWVEHVPEPATMAVLALGGVALLRRKRR